MDIPFSIDPRNSNGVDLFPYWAFCYNWSYFNTSLLLGTVSKLFDLVPIFVFFTVGVTQGENRVCSEANCLHKLVTALKIARHWVQLQ